MSEYQVYILEREKIDHMLEKGYKIQNVHENLSGAFVKFMKSETEEETFHIKTADARKYFSNLLINQSQNV